MRESILKSVPFNPQFRPARISPAPAMKNILFKAIIALLFCTSSVSADIVQFYLTGAGGEGLLESNINPPTGEPGTGGMGANGIFFDTDLNELHIHLEWGSQFGYTDLSADVFKLHLHGPTPDPAPGSYGQTGELLITLSMSNSYVANATGGGVNDFFALDNVNVPHLMDGRTYINVHLTDTDTGVIRGYLVRAVPEPSSMLSLSLLVGFMLSTRRIRNK